MVGKWKVMSLNHKNYKLNTTIIKGLKCHTTIIKGLKCLPYRSKIGVNESCCNFKN